MFEGKTVGIVVPCFNEDRQILGTLGGLPDYVDCVIVVDDASTDNTPKVVQDFIDRQDEPSRIVLLRHRKNRGVGAAVMTGHAEAARRKLDISVVMDGDGQMDPKELPRLLAPVARGEADVAKGNRLFFRGAWQMIPRVRYLGNAFLSMLTKIASGYWHVADSQSTYMALSREVLETVELDKVHPRYGYCNDLLTRMNVYEFRVADISIRPVYGVGERSKMKIHRVVPRLSWLILKRFCWRLWTRYVIHDFHPLVLFYLASFVTGTIGLVLFFRLMYFWAFAGRLPLANTIAWVLCTISATQFMLFAMWFDMEVNRDLKIVYRRRGNGNGNGATAEAAMDSQPVVRRRAPAKAELVQS